MELFEFILILVLITTIGKVLIEVGVPLVNKLGDLVAEITRSRRDGDAAQELDAGVVEELERRLARIEDRLDFLEQLRAPDDRRALSTAPRLDRGSERRGTMEPGTEPEAGVSPTDERTAEGS